MRFWLSLFSPYSPTFIVYMLQAVEYDPQKFLEWFARLRQSGTSVRSTMVRKQLVYTKRAKMLLAAGYILGWLPFLATLLVTNPSGNFPFSASGGILLAVLLLTPVLTIMVIILSVVAGYHIIVVPELRRITAESRKIFVDHPGTKIVVAGSYGKTTMKELLATVLSEKFKVKVTPGNQNTAYSHAKFAQTLQGNEEVLVLELGEGEPGDVEQFANTIRPHYGVVTGLAPNHLDRYGSIQELASDMFSLKNFIADDKLFFASESSLLKSFIRHNEQTYGEGKVGEWRISGVESGLEGVSFTLKNTKKSYKFSSRLLGRHQVAPLALAAQLGLTLGMTPAEVREGISKTVPYEHRMQPYSIGGAWVIDDTYNGNIEGMRAGLELLAELPATRKWYVTPGLVDQGAQTESVHWELAQLIDKTKPDILVLMENSATAIIREALVTMNYQGEVRIETDPLDFYTGLEHILVGGDLVLMQNDWTDNYY